ncbi:ZPR1 zinc-finger domain-containing protein [Jimgerdemannia flammicorona]|uniref:ZPR1 zinc-finger domain-containing protein n=1 Tax=Jimgerdemannia flammicorona TaxID=994334 RepID=A0A433Q628_9FUNG|nr:ZPR1 zinc-finger domain-containing protein [Jimgerdemannia flammicorona]
MADDHQPTQTEQEDPLFQDIDGQQRPTEIESYCMNCGENGITRLLLTRIPHFREVIVMAFECPSCGTRNNEIQSAGIIQDKGQVVTCRVDNKEDLNRQLVKSESCSVRFQELDLEIPASTTSQTSKKSGLLSTIEGLVEHVIDDLSAEQPVRKHANPTVHDQIDTVINKLRSYLDDHIPFTISIDDPAGNSFIEDLVITAPDPKLTRRWYTRTREQDEALGLQSVAEGEGVEERGKEEEEDEDAVPEVMSFPAQCSHCASRADTRMHVLEIPHFKEVVLMSTNCEACGYKSNEVKAGGPVSELGKRIVLRMQDAEDLSRDILKSETCGLSISEINLELTPGTLGGRFTTVEGLLRQVHEELDRRAPFTAGDSTEETKRLRWTEFLAKLDRVADGDPTILPVTLVLDDPLANSYLQNLYAPDDDPNMTLEHYERDWATNEGLGLNDMRLEGYEEDANEAGAEA